MDKMRSLLTLTPKLLAATAQHKLVWSRHPPAGTAYSVSLGDVYVLVWEWTDGNSPETSGVSAQLKTSQEVILDAVICDEYDPNYRQVRDLYLAARRSALNVDSVIADIERKIDLL